MELETEEKVWKVVSSEKNINKKKERNFNRITRFIETEKRRWKKKTGWRRRKLRGEVVKGSIIRYNLRINFRWRWT